MYIPLSLMNHIPRQRLDTSQPLLHEQVPSIQEPLLLQSISFSHGDRAERENIFYHLIYTLGTLVDDRHFGITGCGVFKRGIQN